VAEKPEDDEQWQPVMERAIKNFLCLLPRENCREPDALRFFEEATPVSELENVKIGSRPARRTQTLRLLTCAPFLGLWLDAEPLRSPGVVWRGPCARPLCRPQGWVAHALPHVP